MLPTKQHESCIFISLNTSIEDIYYISSSTISNCDAMGLITHQVDGTKLLMIESDLRRPCVEITTFESSETSV